MVKVKICGVTNLKDALKVQEYGADLIGFVFFRNSPRRIEARAAKNIIDNLSSDILKVGLFLDEDARVVKSTAEECGLDALQLHGNEDVAYCEHLKGKYKIIKSFKVKGEDSIKNVNVFNNVDYYLFDTYLKGMPGGTGIAFEWSVLKGKTFKKPFFLAGGLNPGNVKKAITEVCPYCVDVASGVEKIPGKKDYKLIKEFITNAKNA